VRRASNRCYVGFSAIVLMTSSGPGFGADNVRPSGAYVAEINTALTKADINTLRRLAQHGDAIERTLAPMAIERIRFDLDASNAHARACEQALHDSEPELAFYCARFVPSNARLAGESTAAARQELAIVQRYQGQLPARLLANFDARQAPALASLPETVVTSTQQSRALPIHTDASRAYTTDVTVNGKSVTLKVDTGAPTILGAATAARLGVRIVLAKDGSIRGAMGHESIKQLGVLDSLSLGGTTIQHLPVAVIPEEHNALGMDALRLLGTFELTSDRLIVYGRGSLPPSCVQPIRLSSTFAGSTPAVVLDLMVDGTPHPALMDTGSDFYITGIDHANLPEPPTRGLAIKDVNASGSQAGYSRKTATVQLGDNKLHLTFPELSGVTAPYDFILGNASLRDFRFFVDFNRRTGCVLSKDQRAPDIH